MSEPEPQAKKQLFPFPPATAPKRTRLKAGQGNEKSSNIKPFTPEILETIDLKRLLTDALYQFDISFTYGEDAFASLLNEARSKHKTEQTLGNPAATPEKIRPAAGNQGIEIMTIDDVVKSINEYKRLHGSAAHDNGGTTENV